MKIKNDFITNSSSCCYLVYVPKDFDLKSSISDEKLNKFIDYYYEPSNEEEREKYKNNVVEILKNLDDEYEDTSLILEVLSHLGFEIASVESGGGDSDYAPIINIANYMDKIDKIREKYEGKK